MFVDWNAVKVFVRPGVTDLRKQINGLAVMVQGEMHLDPFSGSLYLFCNRNHRLLKLLYWDRNGFCTWGKRLEKDRFPWAKDGEKVGEITEQELRWLLDGIDFWKAHKKIEYSSVI